MRLCVLTTGHGPADDRVYYKEVLSLLKRPDELWLAAPGTAEEWAKVDERVQRISLGAARGVGGRLRAIPRAIARMRALRPDVIHFHDYELLLAVPFLRLLTRARLVYDAHEMYPDQVQLSDRIPNWLKPFGTWLVHHFERGMVRLCHAIITADQPVADSFAATGVPCEVIYNFPRLELFVPDPERVDQIRAERSGRRLLIYQGSMGIDRGLLQMIESMDAVRRTHPETLLLLVGNLRPALRTNVDRLIAELGLKDHVECVGWVAHSDVVNWIAAADLGLVPFLPVEKYRKNIPVKQFEYMACQLPVIGADLPPIRRFLDTSAAGVLYPAGDRPALQECLLNVLADPSGMTRMGKAGRKAVEEHWNWDRMEVVLLDLYREILSSAAGNQSISNSVSSNSR
ncbi:MAG: glycosyltransferase family 4 protein [Candidatus Delongbacteria bacterium]|nr:glycosyltransferase family 4 protein [Candidatus Delongbacteria bacterium]